ncbi:uncharacterized protein JCM10292_002390 [Rhodotorula paludigena]|uniref:uncharacterized protein n=1 Tax=Rhodotorula paludigena TaxID=86838 RepID=UPI003176EDF1
MSRRHSVRHDDFLSESDLSTSSSESDRDAKVPYRDEDEVAPSTRRRKAVRDGHGSTDSEDDAASPVKQGYAAPPVLASSDESTEDEDEEKLMGLPRSSSKVKTKGKGKKQKRVWEMRSGPGAPAPGAAGGAPPKVSLSFCASPGRADTSSVQNNTACIAISIIIVVVVIAAAGIGIYFANKNGMFDDILGSTTSGVSSGAAGSMGSSSGTSASDSESGAKTGAAGATASGDDEEEGGASLVTTTDEDGKTITGQMAVITENGSAVTTIVPAMGGGSNDDEETASGGHRTKEGEETEEDENATESGGHTGLGGLPRLDTDTLVTTIDGKETTLRGAWQQKLVGGVPSSSFLPMTLDRRTAIPAAPTITPAPCYP